MGNIEELDKKIEKMLKKSEAILSAGLCQRGPCSFRIERIKLGD